MRSRRAASCAVGRVATRALTRSRSSCPLASPSTALALRPRSPERPRCRAFAGRAHFEGFPFGAGGFPGGSPPRGDSEKFYGLLGVPKDADEAQIKTAYKKQAMKHHPDRGGDGATFKEISKAYEVLVDPEKRQIYDQFGEEALENMDKGGGGPQGGMDPFDLFSSIFGFNAGGRRQRGRAVTADSVYELQLSLEELYSGTRRDIVFNRDAVCNTCSGKGGRDVRKCDRCGGTGVQVTMQQLGIMIQQVQSPCSACAGKGYSIPPKSVCQDCKGKGTAKERKTFSIDVERGTKDSTEFRFRGQADEKPNHDTGDVVIVVREKSHKTFQRVQDALLMTKRISLSEALCGFQFSTTFLDGEELVLRSDPTQVLKPGDMMVIKGKGMPRPTGQYGDLLLHVDIDFPSKISPQGQEKLLDILGGQKLPEEPPLGVAAAERIGTRQAQELKRRLAEAARDESRHRRGGGGECTQQ